MPGRVLEHCHNKSKQRVLVRKKTRARRSKVDQRCRIRKLQGSIESIIIMAKLRQQRSCMRSSRSSVLGEFCYEFCPVALVVRAIQDSSTDWLGPGSVPQPASAIFGIRVLPRNMDITCREKRSKNTLMRWYLRPSKILNADAEKPHSSREALYPASLVLWMLQQSAIYHCPSQQPIISQIGILKVARECLSTQPTVRPSMSEIKGIGRSYWHVPQPSKLSNGSEPFCG